MAVQTKTSHFIKRSMVSWAAPNIAGPYNRAYLHRHLAIDQQVVKIRNTALNTLDLVDFRQLDS